MTDERAVEDIVTSFLLNTCRTRPQLSDTAVQAVLWCANAVTASTRAGGEAEADFIPLTTGSVAEFYIEPMLPHIGDIDIMFYKNNQLAIPQGHSPPTQLPDEFDSFVVVYEITDSHLPCYVYLKVRYMLTQDFGELKYNVVKHPIESYLPNPYNDIKSSYIVHGPALVTESLGVRGDQLLPTDIVQCIRCLVWPPQAANWATRHRNDWPDSTTVDRVLNNGCDMVGVAHRQCRQDEWMNKAQWRLSFSRAEIVLINSWTPEQQIVYHLLRVFMKTEKVLSADTEKGTLSNYHIKTLMLWACELKPSIWWTDDLSLVRICVELLHELAVWLTEARCTHYFINDCNLLDNSFNLETISRRLLSLSKSWLSSWFVNNYIRRCSQLCPHNVSRLFDDVSTSVKLQSAILAIVDWRQNSTQIEIWRAIGFAQCGIVSVVSSSSLSVLSLLYLSTELRKISTSLPVYFLSVAFLHVALKTSRSGLNDELMDVTSVLVGQSIGPRRNISRCNNSVMLLRKSVNLMKDIGGRPKLRNTVQLVAIEVSKAYLYRALSSEDCHRDSIYCLANVYLAVLYYTTGQYQTAIDHCTLVMRSQDHSQCSSHVVQGEILPKTDDDIDIVLGLAVFYQHVRISALNQHKQSQHVTMFTTELFAHYLHVKCLSVTKYQQLSDTINSQSSTDDVSSHVKYITDVQQLFIADVLLWKLAHALYGHKFVNTQPSSSRQYTIKCPSEMNTSHLVKLMQKTAVKYMTTFRQLKAREFGSVVTIVTTDFEALYAYKRGDYQHCLLLSTQNVHQLLYAGATESGIWIVPEFIQLLDDDIVSLTALVLIVDPECRASSSFFRVNQVTLSLYLMTQCQLKLRHSVTSLAQSLDYIKVAHRKHPVESTLDRLILKMIAHKAVTYVRSIIE